MASPLQRPADWSAVLSGLAAEGPDAPAFTQLADNDGDPEVLTYAALDRRARAIAVHLTSHGLTGRPVLLLYPSGLDYVAAFFGCLYAGVIAVPAYPPTREPRSIERVETIIADSGAIVAMTTASLASRLRDRSAVIGSLRMIATDAVDPTLAESWQAARPADPGAVAFLQYTSGSTATPRGVILTQENLLANCELITERFATSRDSTIVSWLPMYHDMGLIGSVLGTVHSGGHCVTMSPQSFARDPFRWLDIISRTGAYASGGPNFGYDLCVERITPEQRAGLDLSGWKVAFNGAEPVRDGTLRRFAETFAGSGFAAEALTPCYGLAEATLMVSAKPGGTGHVVDATGLVSSGVSVPGQRLEIVDPATRLTCPQGSIGEIWLSGESVTGGYWRRPELTVATFRATLEGTTEPHFLRTGDLGYRSGDELFVTGRIKDLVIIRGRNHYPQDIEHSAGSAHPALSARGGVAFAVESEAGEELVVVNEVHRDHRNADLADVAARVRLAIARDHELRVASVVLIKAGTLPRTSSGKIRRGACRDAFTANKLKILHRSDDGVAKAETGLEAPIQDYAETAGVTSLRNEIAALLAVDPSSLDTGAPLIELGVDSITAVRLTHRLGEVLGADLAADEVLAMTMPELAASRTGRPAPPRRESGAEPGDHPLSAGQRALWFVDRFDPHSAAQIIAVTARVVGEPDVSALAAAASALAARQASLRTTFPVVDGEAVQRVHERLEPRFERFDVSEVDTVGERLRAAAEEPFDLLEGPLFRITVLSRSADEHWIVLAIHHIVSDLWSMQILLRDLEKLYLAAKQGVLEDVPRVTRGCARRAGAQEAILAGPAGARLFDYWRDRLEGVPATLALPTDRPRVALRRPRGARQRLAIGEDLTASLKRLAKSKQVTLHDVLLSAYQLLLSQASGSPDVLVGTPAHGREAVSDADTIGYFVNMLPMRGTFRATQTFTDVLRRTRDTTTEALRHAALPFATLVEQLRPAREAGVPRLVQAVFAWQQFGRDEGGRLAPFALGEAGGEVAFADLRLRVVERTDVTPQFDLALTMAEIGGGLGGTLDYNADLFDATTIARLAGHLTDLLAAAANRPGATLAELPVLHRDSVLTGAAVTVTPRTAHAQFADRVAAAPESIALAWEGGSLSYRELDTRATALAARLVAAGVGAEHLVGLCLDRSPEWVVSVLAVFKAGGAYVPLDPAYPADRLGYILSDSAARVIVTRGELRDRLPSHGALVVDLAEPAPEALPVTLPAPDLDRLAYVIYTSGSTGRPKGTLLDHRGLANLLAAMTLFDFDERDAWALFHSVAFDYSVWEMWGPLTSGGTAVVVAVETAHHPEALWDLVRRHRITVLNQTPAVFSYMAAGGAGRLADIGLRHILLSGERLEPAHLTDWAAAGDPRTRIANLYGITETSVLTTYREITDPSGRQPLGDPLPGTEIRLLDFDGLPVPVGSPGEICVGGPSVARGYLNRPSLTARRFVPHPERSGERLYRSGDLARYTSDGELEYIGRSDHQVKIRGYRIETGEIEAVLEDHPAVRKAVVLARPDRTGQHVLVAYVVGEPAAVDAVTMRAHLRERLPDYMVPPLFLTLPELPLTPNGKVDRAALPDPDAEPDAEYLAPVTDTERWLATLIAGLLELPRLGRHDDVLALGGHSLLVARVALRVRDGFGVEIPLRELFTDDITVARIAELIDGATSAPVAAAPRLRRVDRTRYEVARSADGRLRLPDAMKKR
ncbi:amino acid adenylation domain-containing protein [Amycolatopsis sp. NPDC005232]|uniref:amino acid adenylation domain-containing protein n=1 Tax=Amycolatopsis sp. NPDC005232 TaxID=3157027 RepID=UPI0033A7F6F8